MRKTTLALALLAGPALADGPLIPDGVTPPAEHLGHVFMTLCAPNLSPLMESDFESFDDLFNFTPREGDTDYAIGSPDDLVQVTFDSSWRGAVCEMTVAAEHSGDGAAIYDDLIANLEEKVDALPEAEFVDGGLVWSWAREGAVDVTFTVEFIENDAGHILRTTSEN